MPYYVLHCNCCRPMGWCSHLQDKKIIHLPTGNEEQGKTQNMTSKESFEMTRDDPKCPKMTSSSFLDLDCRFVRRNSPCCIPCILPWNWRYVENVSIRMDLVVCPNAIFFNHFLLWWNQKIFAQKRQQMGRTRNLLLDLFWESVSDSEFTANTTLKMFTVMFQVNNISKTLMQLPSLIVYMCARSWEWIKNLQ